jgi:hypothetical protein
MGPTAGVLLRFEPNETHVRILEDAVNAVASANASIDDFHVEDTFSLGGIIETSNDPRPFGTAFDSPLLEESELSAFNAAFGFAPVSELSIWAMCNDQVDHRVLGEMTAYFAERFDGIVAFGGVLNSGAPESGQLVRLPYEVDGRQLFSHAADATFMRYWLASPDFHMIK